MIVLLIAALAVAALLAAGSWIARSRARERRELLDGARRAAAAAEARAEEERRRTAAEASDALTSVIPAIRLPWPTQPTGLAAHGDGYGALRGDYPAFSALSPFQAGEEPAGDPDGYAEDLGTGDQDGCAAPGARPGEHVVPAPRPGEHGPGEHGPADHQRRRVAQGSHRGGHAKRRRG